MLACWHVFMLDFQTVKFISILTKNHLQFHKIHDEKNFVRWLNKASKE